MIKIERSKQDYKLYLKELMWLFCEKAYIILILFCPAMVYCLLFGYLYSDKEVIMAGYIMLAIVVLASIRVLSMYFSCRKALNITFEDTNSEGNIEYLFSEGDHEFILENITNKTLNRIKFKDIKKFKFSKKCVFIILNSSQIVWFKKTDELMDFVKVYLK